MGKLRHVPLWRQWAIPGGLCLGLVAAIALLSGIRMFFLTELIDRPGREEWGFDDAGWTRSRKIERGPAPLRTSGTRDFILFAVPLMLLFGAFLVAGARTFHYASMAPAVSSDEESVVTRYELDAAKATIPIGGPAWDNIGIARLGVAFAGLFGLMLVHDHWFLVLNESELAAKAEYARTWRWKDEFGVILLIVFQVSAVLLISLPAIYGLPRGLPSESKSGEVQMLESLLRERYSVYTTLERKIAAEKEIEDHRSQMGVIAPRWLFTFRVGDGYAYVWNDCG